MDSSIPTQIAEVVQTAHINRAPSPRHDLNPSTAASTKVPAHITSAKKSSSEGDDEDEEDDDDEDEDDDDEDDEEDDDEDEEEDDDEDDDDEDEEEEDVTKGGEKDTGVKAEKAKDAEGEGEGEGEEADIVVVKASPETSQELVEEEEEDIPLSVLVRPREAARRGGGQHPHRRPQFPPMPDLRFEQSYLHSIAGAQTTGRVVWITLRDQVIMPLAQGVLYNLAVVGWQHWNRNAQLSGSSVGARIRRWWYGVNNWPLPKMKEKTR